MIPRRRYEPEDLADRMRKSFALKYALECEIRDGKFDLRATLEQKTLLGALAMLEADGAVQAVNGTHKWVPLNERDRVLKQRKQRDQADMLKPRRRRVEESAKPS